MQSKGTREPVPHLFPPPDSKTPLPGTARRGVSHLVRAGIEAEIFEQASEVRELGVGVNMLPHTVKELAALGLLSALDRVGIRARRLLLMTRHGQTVWDELHGLDAGYDVPHISIHRGELQRVLYQVALDRLGPDCIYTGHRLVGFDERGQDVVARFERRADEQHVEVSSDLLVGADGIHSALRACLYPDELPPSDWRLIGVATFPTGDVALRYGRP